MRQLVIFSFLLLLLFSCRKEVDIFVDEDPITDPPAELVVTSIYGQVVSESSLPVPDAVIKIRDYEVKTDANGYFEFDKIQANRFGTQIIASKDGFVRNIQTVYPRLNQQMFRTIILSEKVNSATFLTTSGTTIDLGKQTSLIIPPRSIVYTADGTDYSGEVRLIWSQHHISDEHFLNLIPGELTGLDTAKAIKGLSPIGVIQMEMTDVQGNALRLAQGKTARMQYHIPEDYKGVLESTVPFWYFDVKKNTWIQSSDAIKQSAQSYEVNLSGISSWCMAYPQNIIPFKGTLTATDGNGLTNFSVVVSSGLDKLELSTDNGGYFYGNVPANKPLTVEILNDCGYLVKQETIGPATTEITFEKQLVENTSCKTIPISGFLLDCEGNKITNGYVLLTSDNNRYFLRTDSEGKVSGQFRMCGNIEDAQLEAVDYENNIQATMDVNVLLGQAVQLGQWKICDRVDGYISLQFNDDLYLLNEEVTVDQDNDDVIFSAASAAFGIECWVKDFHGEGIYLMPSQSTADFVVSFFPILPNAPNLVPKDISSFSTYKLEISKYVENELMQGKIQGLVRDENNNNEEGMMYMKFSIPLRQ